MQLPEPVFLAAVVWQSMSDMEIVLQLAPVTVPKASVAPSDPACGATGRQIGNTTTSDAATVTRVILAPTVTSNRLAHTSLQDLMLPTQRIASTLM